MAEKWTELKEEDLEKVNGGYEDKDGNEIKANDYVTVPSQYTQDVAFHTSCIAWATQISGFSNGNAVIRFRYIQVYGCNSSFISNIASVPPNELTKTTKPWWAN